jgi:hypothetical protein
MSQAALDFGGGWRCAQAWAELLETLNAAVTHVGRKEAAYNLDTSPSQLANALAERDRHYLRASWLPYLVAVAPSHRPVEILAGLRGLELSPRKPMTPAEELAELRAAVAAECGPTQRDAIERRVRGGPRR